MGVSLSSLPVVVLCMDATKHLNAVSDCIDGSAVKAGGKDGFFSSCA